MRDGAGQNGLTSDFIVALDFCLPVIFEYDFSIARSLSDNLPYPLRDEAWCSIVFWSLCRSFLGDHRCRAEDLRVKVDHPRLNTVIKAAEEINHDVFLYDAIEAITSAVQSSFGSMIDLNQAIDVLQQLEHLASRKLPEPSQRNIKHNGYLILAQAQIHGARSAVYHKEKRHKGRLSSKDIRHRWSEICNGAKAIPNAADRVFVMALIAPEMALHYSDDLGLAKDLLETAEEQIGEIPTLIDRADRLETIAKSWESVVRP